MTARLKKTLHNIAVVESHEKIKFILFLLPPPSLYNRMIFDSKCLLHVEIWRKCVKENKWESALYLRFICITNYIHKINAYVLYPHEEFLNNLPLQQNTTDMKTHTTNHSGAPQKDNNVKCAPLVQQIYLAITNLILSQGNLEMFTNLLVWSVSTKSLEFNSAF